MFSKLTKEERDECIKKFREGSINVIIATNVLSRGFDMHTIKLVINFDVPSQRKNDILVPDYESYLHRVGRSGRFGNTGVALTLFDRADDEKLFFNIISHY
jgi:ATP-dependent RNA helicase DDX19/DBP5